jgi:hypothetical protein
MGFVCREKSNDLSELETLKLKSLGKGADLRLDSVCARHGPPKIMLRLLRNPAFGAAAKRYGMMWSNKKVHSVKPLSKDRFVFQSR